MGHLRGCYFEAFEKAESSPLLISRIGISGKSRGSHYFFFQHQTDFSRIHLSEDQPDAELGEVVQDIGSSESAWFNWG